MTQAPSPPSPLADAPAALVDAVEQGLGALLGDRDVSDIASLEGGMIEVTRRGRRQRLDVVLEGPLFSLVREALPHPHSVLRLRLRGGHTITGATLADGRLAVRVTRAPALDATLRDLEEEGLLPAGIGDELLAAMRGGTGVLVVGTSHVGRQRLVSALVRAAQADLALFGITDNLSNLLPVPLARGADVSLRARTASALGAEGICALELDAPEVAALIRTCPGVPLLASVVAASVDALDGSLQGASRTAAAAHIAVIGRGPEGLPRLSELHGPPTSGPLPEPGDVAPEDVERDHAPVDVLPAVASGRAGPARAATVVVDDPAGGDVPPLDELPAGWASDAPDDDPGWELAGAPSLPPEPGSFDAALAAHKQRPAFTPRAPQQHPQTRALHGRGLGKDPFGGLTFEPPPGGPGPDEGEP